MPAARTRVDGGVDGAETGPKPPKLVAPRLGTLDEIDLTTLESGEMRTDERYADVDLGDLDLSSGSFVGCAFERVRMGEPGLRGIQLADCTITELDAAVLEVPRSSWRSVSVGGSRIGSGEAYECVWRSVLVQGSKINYLNARSAQWRDVVFSDCVIGELDLSHATATRVVFERCRIDTLELGHATLTDVDLRQAALTMVNGLDGLAGAWISRTQLLEFAPLLATHLGLRVAGD